MVGFNARPTKLKICYSHYSSPIYEAPIYQDMLFGVDLLTKAAVLNMGKDNLTYKGEEIIVLTQSTV